MTDEIIRLYEQAIEQLVTAKTSYTSCRVLMNGEVTLLMSNTNDVFRSMIDTQCPSDFRFFNIDDPDDQIFIVGNAMLAGFESILNERED